jgi:CubicO group peptidase (beta-lactamase class C family)
VINDLEEDAPDSVGLDPALLQVLTADLEADRYLNSHAVLIARKGKLGYEWHAPGHDGETPHELRSATKSIGSVLIGIAIDQGFISGVTERGDCHIN